MKKELIKRKIMAVLAVAVGMILPIASAGSTLQIAASENAEGSFQWGNRFIPQTMNGSEIRYEPETGSLVFMAGINVNIGLALSMPKSGEVSQAAVCTQFMIETAAAQSALILDEIVERIVYQGDFSTEYVFETENGRLIKMKVNGGREGVYNGLYEVVYSYDTEGNLTALDKVSVDPEYPHPGDYTHMEFAYDQSGRLCFSTSSGPAGDIMSWLDYTVTADDQGRVLHKEGSAQTADGTLFLDIFDYTYDEAGNLTVTAETAGTANTGDSGLSTTEYHYEYDANGCPVQNYKFYQWNEEIQDPVEITWRSLSQTSEGDNTAAVSGIDIRGIWETARQPSDVLIIDDERMTFYNRTAEAMDNPLLYQFVAAASKEYIISDLHNGEGIQINLAGEGEEASYYWCFADNPDTLECRWGVDGEGYSGSSSYGRSSLTLEDLEIYSSLDEGSYDPYAEEVSDYQETGIYEQEGDGGVHDLSEWQAELDAINAEMDNAQYAMSQVEMNEILGQAAEHAGSVYDGLTAEIRSFLSPDEANGFDADEAAWQQVRQNAMDNTAQEYYGGSAMGMAIDETFTRETISHCQELLFIYGNAGF